MTAIFVTIYSVDMFYDLFHTRKQD